MEKGKISVIMGIRNCQDTLPAAIESILKQSYTNWELILCDDASTDDTFQVAKAFQKQYPEKIKLIQHEHNLFLAQSLNDCLKLATGEYIARMDGDDECLPERFEKQVAFLRTHPEIQLVGTAMRRFDEHGFGAVDTKLPFPQVKDLRHQPCFNHATIMAYKAIFDQLGGYTVCNRTKRGQDYDLWFRFFAAGYQGMNMPDPLYLVREDVNAVKRRTFEDRWINFETMMVGYRLLNYPLHYYVFPVKELAKVLVPTGLVMRFRAYQKKRASKLS